MGQHKHNPTAIAKAQGKPLPSKPKKLGARASKRLLRAEAAAYLREKTGLPAELLTGKYSEFL